MQVSLCSFSGSIWRPICRIQLISIWFSTNRTGVDMICWSEKEPTGGLIIFLKDQHSFCYSLWLEDGICVIARKIPIAIDTFLWWSAPFSMKFLSTVMADLCFWQGAFPTSPCIYVESNELIALFNILHV